MTEIEAKALALVNTHRKPGDEYCEGLGEAIYSEIKDALLASIAAHESDKTRHAAEMRELKERFSEAARTALAEALKTATCANERGAIIGPILAPFILPASDPLFEAMKEVEPMTPWEPQDAAQLRAAIEARGGKIVWEAGE